MEPLKYTFEKKSCSEKTYMVVSPDVPCIIDSSEHSHEQHLLSYYQKLLNIKDKKHGGESDIGTKE